MLRMHVCAQGLALLAYKALATDPALVAAAALELVEGAPVTQAAGVIRLAASFRALHTSITGFDGAALSECMALMCGNMHVAASR
jgi:hypothetical protein